MAFREATRILLAPVLTGIKDMVVRIEMDSAILAYQLSANSIELQTEIEGSLVLTANPGAGGGGSMFLIFTN